MFLKKTSNPLCDWRVATVFGPLAHVHLPATIAGSHPAMHPHWPYLQLSFMNRGYTYEHD